MSDGLGPEKIDQDGWALENGLRQVLSESQVGPEEVGLVLTSGSGLAELDRCELQVLSRVFAKERDKPALGFSSRLWGNLVEAGGLGEIGLLEELYKRKRVPDSMAKSMNGDLDTDFGQIIDQTKRHAMIVRVSPSGESTCLLVKWEGEA